jgi:Ala-tRNA(Pro) deacylase
MVIQKLKEYLDENGVKYTATSHSPAFSAQEVAALVHCPGKELAKTVLVVVREDLAMMVLPANYHVDFHRLGDTFNTGNMYLATEEEFADRFPDCELGAMPPFGNLYGLKTYVAKSLAEDEHITFNAGTHSDCITLDFKDYERLVEPEVISFTDRPHPEEEHN